MNTGTIMGVHRFNKVAEGLGFRVHGLRRAV